MDSNAARQTSQSSQAQPAHVQASSDAPHHGSPGTGLTSVPESSGTSPAAELARRKQSIVNSLRHFADFPIPGIDFVDIMPLFQSPSTHLGLLIALELQVNILFANAKPDVIVGLDARGFLFGPSLALRLGAGFTAVRKMGKLPGPCVSAEYVKEYGKDFFEMQKDGIKNGQRVLVVDDIIATGGSARAAGDLVTQLGGDLMGYLFLLEIPGLKGREKLGGAPVSILIEEA